MSIFTVTCVCDGNICRSPIAAYALQQYLGDEHVRINSAGLRAVVGSGVDPETSRVARSMGLSLGRHSATQIDEPLANEASLALTMTARQRDEFVGLYPRVLRRTFTLAEFAYLIMQRGRYEGEELSQVIRAISLERGGVVLTRDDDIRDPYLAPENVHIEAVKKIIRHCQEIASVLNG